MTESDERDNPLDRRPIRSRSTNWAGTLAAAVVRTGVSPNAISMIGMLAGIGAGLLMALTGRVESETARRLIWIAAAACIQLRLLCNMLDGMVALATGKASRLGELFNDVPDRVADAAILIGAGFAVGSNAALGYIAALFAVSTAYVRTLGKSLGAPSDFCGPMAKPQRMCFITLGALYIGLAPATWRPAWGPGEAWGVMAGVLVLIVAGTAFTVARRLWRIGRALQGREP